MRAQLFAIKFSALLFLIKWYIFFVPQSIVKPKGFYHSKIHTLGLLKCHIINNKFCCSLAFVWQRTVVKDFEVGMYVFREDLSQVSKLYGPQMFLKIWENRISLQTINVWRATEQMFILSFNISDICITALCCFFTSFFF